MTPETYANLVEDVYNALRRQKWLDDAALKLTEIYFTSGAYKNDEASKHADDN